MSRYSEPLTDERWDINFPSGDTMRVEWSRCTAYSENRWHYSPFGRGGQCHNRAVRAVGVEYVCHWHEEQR